MEKYLSIFELRLDSQEKLDTFKRLCPDNQIRFNKLLPVPEELPEIWDDELILNIYRHSLSAKFFDEGPNDIHIAEYVFPGNLVTSQILAYLANRYPELLKRYQRFIQLKFKYDGVFDRKHWRQVHWSCDFEPETLKLRVDEVSTDVYYYRFVMSSPEGWPSYGLIHIANALQLEARVWPVLDYGLLESPFYSRFAQNRRISEFPQIDTIFDTGFTLKELGIRFNRRGCRGIQLI